MKVWALGVTALLFAAALAGCAAPPSAGPLPDEGVDRGTQDPAPTDGGPEEEVAEGPDAGEGSEPAASEDGPPTPNGSDDTPPEEPAPPYEPHVIVAIADTGVNPYHEAFYRPDRTAHPCTYIEDFPCDLPPLDLSIGVHDTWADAVNADIDLWRAIEPGDWFWIPRTVFVGVGCQLAQDGDNHPGIPQEPLCILDDNDHHGTGIASAVLSENPGALLVFMESHDQDHVEFDKTGIPIDVYSHSNGFNGPSPYVGPTGPLLNPLNPIYVRAAGNQPDTTLDKYSRAHPDVIAVGGAFAADRSAPLITTKTMDVVSYFYRPGASADSLDGLQSHGGTSIATPTVAGAISKVILGLRQESGHTGGTQGQMVDPILGISIGDLRDAINATASYEPEPKYPDTAASSDNVLAASAPLTEEAPWLQWGWGFYDGWIADRTLAVLLGAAAPAKPAEAHLWQESQYSLRGLLYD